MGFTFYTNIPGADNDPSVDQPKMLQNNIAIDQIVNVDHYSFGDINNNDGKHQQLTLPIQNAPGVQTDPASTLYTGAGSASTNSQLLYRNEDQIFMCSPIRAFGVFTESATLASLDNSFGVASITGNLNFKTVTLNTNIVTGNNVCVFVSKPGSGTFGWSFTNPVLTITNGTQGVPGGKVSFIILQA